MVTSASGVSAIRALPAYEEALRLRAGVVQTGGSETVSRDAGFGFGRDRFVRGEIPESERDPGLAAYQRAGKVARGGQGAAGEDQEVVREVNRLRARDQAVRSHEAAHVAAGGSHIRGAASFTYETGPDGRQYAVGGEVPIDVSPVSGNPQATISKMTAVRAAALAPGDPSSADVAVANAAAQAIAQAQVELREEHAPEVEATSSAPGSEADRGKEPTSETPRAARL